jgi:hypothetical protein
MAVFFADGTIASATVIDAQLNYNLPSLKSTLKLELQILEVKNTVKY